jgi:MoxR-like ATPase
MTDEQVIAYFRAIEGKDAVHAANSCRFLRKLYVWSEERQEWIRVAGQAPRRSPRNGQAFTPAPMAEVEALDLSDLKQPIWEAQAPEPMLSKSEVQTFERIQEPKAPKAQPLTLNAQDPMAALALALAPHLRPMLEGLDGDEVTARIQAQIKAALENYQPKQTHDDAPRGQIIVMKPKTAPRLLDGIHHKDAAKVIKLAAHGLNVMMVGPAGCGKTVIAKSAGLAFKKRTTIISCSAGMTEAQLLGRLLPLGEGGSFVYVESPFVKAYREGGVILLDELDAADSNLLLAINSALANGEMYIEARAASGLDVRVERHPETVILAAANTWGSGSDTQYVGRGALDASTLDRFYRLAVDYDHALEARLGPSEVVAKVHAIRAAVREKKIRRVVSTRLITRLSQAMAAGYTMTDALVDELGAWTQDERQKVAHV